MTLLGVAVGVASVVSIQVLNQGALLAFEGSMQAVSGQADLSVLGTTPSFDESLYGRVLEDPAVTGAWPLVRVDVAVAGRNDLFLDVVGFDIFAPVRYPLTGMTGPEDSTNLVVDALSVPGWIAVTPGLAASEGWSLGDTLTVSSGSRLALLTIGALVDFQKYEPMAPSRLAVMDISQAQGLLARKGRIHQIDLTLADGIDVPIATARLQKTLGPGVRVLSPEQRRQDTRGLLAAFRLNLTALSLISIFVALFLVLTSIQASLVRRRGEFGLLRSLGATRGQVMTLVLAEAGALGLLGVLVGIPLGYFIALMNIDTVSATLTSIYVIDGLEKMTLPVEVVLLGIAVGLLGAMGAAVLPAVDISRRDTVQLMSPVALHRRTGKWAGRLALLALATALVATIWFALPRIGTAPRRVRLRFFDDARPPLDRAVGGAHALPAGKAPPDRTGSEPAQSTGPTADHQFCRGRPGGDRQHAGRHHPAGGQLPADAGHLAGHHHPGRCLCVHRILGPGRQRGISWTEPLLDELADLPGVQAVETQRRLQVRTTDGDHLVWLNGVTTAGIAGAELSGRLPLMAGDPVQVARRLADRGCGHDRRTAGPQGPVGRRRHPATGRPPTGPVVLPVAGIAYDYTSEGGTAFLVGEVFAEHFGTGPPNNAALFLDPDLAGGTVCRLLERRGMPGVRWFSAATEFSGPR